MTVRVLHNNVRGVRFTPLVRTAQPGGAVGRAAARLPRYMFASWLVLIGLLVPAAEVQIFIGGAKFTTARLALVALVIPAIYVWMRRGRRVIMCDVAVAVMVIWTLAAASTTSDSESMSSAAAVTMEILFSYLVGRAFYLEAPALDTFIRTLRMMTFVIVSIAIFEVVTGRWLAHETAAMIAGTSPLGAVFRQGILRATSTLDHPILFGVFCALVNVILLFWERRTDRRVLSSFICLTGCILSQSSAAIMAYALGTAAYGYEHLFRSVSARWTIFWSVVACVIGAVFIVSQHPIGWLISNLTLDPQSGYFRILIWNLAFVRIEQSPLVGHSFQMFGDPILDTTIDCVWLVNALRFGIPASALLLLANLAAVWPKRRSRSTQHDRFVEQMSLAFTAVLLLLMFTGITVHFWNYMWVFWGLCLGVRGALRESSQKPA